MNEIKCQNPETLHPSPKTPPLDLPFTPLVHSSPLKNCSKVSPRLRLNLPGASAKSEWNAVNEAFQDIIPGMFPPELTRAFSPTEFADKVDDFVYNTLLDRFGAQEPKKNIIEKIQNQRKLKNFVPRKRN